MKYQRVLCNFLKSEFGWAGSHAGKEDEFSLTALASVGSPPITRSVAKIGRNDPCPCGSGKKSKKCHVRAA